MIEIDEAGSTGRQKHYQQRYPAPTGHDIKPIRVSTGQSVAKPNDSTGGIKR